MTVILVCTNKDAQNFRRIDVYLEHKLEEFNRTQIKKLHELNCFTTPDGGPISLSKKVAPGLIIHFLPPQEDLFKKDHLSAQAQEIPLDIIYEDEHLALINKPVGLVTHPAPGHPDNTLVNAILHRFGPIQTITNSYRPGIVHRLDQGTSGIMAVAKHEKSQELLIALFSKHDLTRKYQALVFGQPKLQTGTITSTIGRHPMHRQKMKANVSNGKNAITHYKVLKTNKPFSHMELTLETGRTHQIRVHLAQILSTPILLDPIYSHPSRHLPYFPESIRQIASTYAYPLLHACHLSFSHPITGNLLEYSVKPPEFYQNIQNTLEL